MAFTRRRHTAWQLRTHSVPLGRRTLVMGILNVTPDSFSDGGRYQDKDAAVQRALYLLQEGADILDIGGESTRPGAARINPQVEQSRVVPVIEAILRERPDCMLSIDTYHADTARMAVAAGAEIVNDVSGFEWDDEMAAACSELGCGVVLMHTRGRPEQWKALPRLAQDEVLSLVRSGLERSLQWAAAAGIRHECLVVDPGFGFGKAFENNFPLLAHLEQLRSLGSPVLAGVSRKSFLKKTVAARLGRSDSHEQTGDIATVAAVTAAILAGADIVRVHDVRAAAEAAAIADSVLESA